MPIPFLSLKDVTARQHDELLAAIDGVLRSGRYLNGPQLAAFEAEFAAFCGVERCVGVASGLDALTLMLMALSDLRGWKAGDEIIVPAMTFVATALAVSRAGLTPVFADVDRNGLLSPADVEKRITPRTRALLPVHLYGHMADVEALASIADRHGLLILEDAAQSHGAESAAGRAGAVGHAAAFSFYPGKNLGSLGDGGAVTTNDAALADRVRTLANYGATQKYHHDAPGLNSRLSEMQAAVLRTKLPLLPADNARRRAIAAIYSRGIKHAGIRVPYDGRTEESVFHIYPIFSDRRDELQKYLSAAGIETLCHYPLAVTQQKVYRHAAGSFPMAERLAATELSLPISPCLTDNEANFVVESINNFPS